MLSPPRQALHHEIWKYDQSTKERLPNDCRISQSFLVLLIWLQLKALWSCMNLDGAHVQVIETDAPSTTFCCNPWYLYILQEFLLRTALGSFARRGRVHCAEALIHSSSVPRSEASQYGLAQIDYCSGGQRVKQCMQLAAALLQSVAS